MSTTTTITAQVRCVRKAERDNPWERIVGIGGVNDDGGRWYLRSDEAIDGIESSKYRFYVERPAGSSVWVIVAVSASGRKYLKTEADGLEPNNLLSLPECP
ncbi:MAG: DUF3892 domain-containing protein [Actinomycetota bacterium]